MFDVRPTAKSRIFQLPKIEKINFRPTPIIGMDEELFSRLPKASSKRDVLEEFERVMAEPINVVAELASVGGRLYPNSRTKLQPEDTSDIQDFWSSTERNKSEDRPITETTGSYDTEQSNNMTSPAGREIDIWLENVQKNRQILSPSAKFSGRNKNGKSIWSRIKPKWSSWFRRRNLYVFGTIAALTLASGVIYKGGVGARNNVVQNSGNAVANLQDAKQDLEAFDFNKAANSFALAYDDLNKASGTMSEFGASFLSIFGNLPGLDKLKAANNLVEAGQSLSKAGENLSLAFSTLYQTNLLSFLGGTSGSSNGQQSLSKLLGEFKNVLVFADGNIKKANILLADIDSSAIPQDKQQLLIDFKEKIPDFQKYVGEAVNYSDFLLKLVGSDGPKTYLLLLQNNSELRPTGGFPGTYGLITFDNGTLKKVFIEDIYRADANLKENIIPPIPLQHITPNWGMRDANWFADFPTSAKKVSQFYKLDSGIDVDGVLTITPDVIAKIFDVIGSIDMPEYNLKLDSSNFMTAIQNEVEYQADRSAPKQILSDLQPRFFQRLAEQNKDQWLEIFKILTQAAAQKHILAYFSNSGLEKVALENGIGGEIKSTTSINSLAGQTGQVSDYLQVVFANVKGSKTDFITDNSMSLETSIDSNVVAHSLTINRKHNGGDSSYGFYNRDNSAYIKVYVPQGSVLDSINGQTMTDFKPLVDYASLGFKEDPDLASIEGAVTHPLAGVDVFQESYRTVFGFWLITKPKQTQSVILKYHTPSNALNISNYDLFWQKESGTSQDKINFSLTMPDGKKFINQSGNLQLMGNNLTMASDLLVDREIDVEFK